MMNDLHIVSITNTEYIYLAFQMLVDCIQSFNQAETELNS